MWYSGREGKHDFRPITHFWKAYRKPKKVLCEIEFGEGSDYNILPDRDQWDYSKLQGLSFSLRGNNYNAIMFGWSYDPKAEKYRVVGYINDKGSNNWTPYIEVEKGRRLVLTYEIKGNTVFFNLAGTEFELDISFKCRWGRRIGMWFGGNKPCPQDMKIWSIMRVN